MKPIGEAIKDQREQIGMTQTELAKAVGTTQQQIAKYESDKQNPTVNRLRDIAKALGVRYTDLDI